MRPPTTPPMSGPTTGIHAYPQSDGPLPAIGRIACMMRGPRSRAGLIAYPVGPPSDRPMPSTSRPTISGPSAVSAVALLAKNARIPNTSTKVPMISVIMFDTGLRIAGPVEKQASFSPGSSVSLQWSRYASQTKVAPMNAPTNSPARYSGTSLQSMVPAIANPTVTAGLRWAPLNWPTANAAVMTAMPHPQVMTIQPLFSPLELASRTQATTPLPSRIRMAVPITSAPKILTAPPLSPRRTDGRRRHGMPLCTAMSNRIPAKVADLRQWRESTKRAASAVRHCRTHDGTPPWFPACLRGQPLRGRAQEQLRGRRARVLVVHAARAEVAGAALLRLHRDRREHALARGIGRPQQGLRHL